MVAAVLDIENMKCFFSAWSEDGKWMGNWILFCMCLWFYCPRRVLRLTQSSTMVIWITQVNCVIFVTEINGKKWPNLPYVHVNLRFMRWSHTFHPQDRCFWRAWVYIEREISHSLLHQCNTQFHTDLHEAETIPNIRQKHFQCFPQGLFLRNIYSLCETWRESV